MKKFLLVVSLISVTFLAGCTNDNGNTESIENQVDNTQYEVTENDEEDVVNENLAQEVANNKSEEEIIIKQLVQKGEWTPSSAEKSGDAVELVEVYGTGIRYGGGITFYDDGTFEKFIGITSEDPEDEAMYNYGKYSINTETKQIVYTFNAGNISYGEYEFEDGELLKITFEEPEYKVIFNK